MIDFFKNKKIAIVGNSPNIINKSLGNLIDSYDVVVRFNDYSLSNKKDYGEKCNVWVRASNDYVIETLNEKNLKEHDLIIVRSKNKKNEKSLDFYRGLEYNYVIMPIEYEISLSKELKAIPSTGLLTLYFMKSNNIKYDAFAFSFFSKNDLINYKTHHYYNYKANKESKGIMLSKHNWNVEQKYFIKNCMEKN